MLGFTRKAPDATPARPAPVTPRLEMMEDRVTPTLFAITDTYTVQQGRVLTVPAGQGVLVNDYSDLNPGSALRVTNNTIPRYTNNPQPLPTNALTGGLQLNKIAQDGSFTFTAPANVPLNAGPVTFTYTVINNAGETATGTVTINIEIANQKLIATGADAGAGPRVRVFNALNATPLYDFFPYESTFTGGVRVAVGDLNGDGYDDIATVPETGGSVRVRVFSGKDGSTILDTFAFDSSFRGGGYVAIGDFNGDGHNDLIVGAGVGGGPRVQVYSLTNTGFLGAVTTSTLIADFFAYDSSQRFGVQVAAGDLEGIGRSDIVTVPGVGGTPQVRVFNAQEVFSNPTPPSFNGIPSVANVNPNPTLSFLATNADQTSGVSIAVGKLDASGHDDIITGSGSGNGIVQVFDGTTGGLVKQFNVPVENSITGGGTASGPSTFNITSQSQSSGTLVNGITAPTGLVPNAFAGTTTLPAQLQGVVQAGVRVAAVDYNGDGIDDIVVASGPGVVPLVRIFDAASNLQLTSIQPYENTFLGGVNVAASRQ